jgi:predicted nucleic acid-binding protein
MPATASVVTHCMVVMRFVDTSILLYAVGTTKAYAGKRAVALTILDDDDLTLSAQVLQEFYVQSTRVSRPDHLAHEQAANLIEAWLRYPVQPITKELVQASLSTRLRWNISYWDAAIIEAARAAGCPVVLSEDLQHGMDFAGVRVENPFLAV